MIGTWYICTNTWSTHTVCLNALFRISAENVETHVHGLWGITSSTVGSVPPVCLLPSPGFLWLLDTSPFLKKRFPGQEGALSVEAVTHGHPQLKFLEYPHCSLSPGLVSESWSMVPILPPFFPQLPHPGHLALIPEIAVGFRKMHYNKWIWEHSLHFKNLS